MREIKFRAWDENLKLMINPYCELKDGRFWGEDCTNNPYSVKHEHVMQFTGLKDKNGKEIYEGDIVIGNTLKSNPCAVSFENGSFMWHKEPLCWDLENEPTELCLPERWGQVIGNIYQNPELLVS